MSDISYDIPRWDPQCGILTDDIKWRWFFNPSTHIPSRFIIVPDNATLLQFKIYYDL